MSRARFGLILAAALIAICAALYLSSQRNLQRDTHGVPLLPALAPELDTVTELSVRKGSATPAVTLHRSGDARSGAWSVAQRGDYPADLSKVNKLLLALSDAKIVEEKTSDPANYPIIGVEDSTQPGAAGAEVTVIAKDGKHVLIVGKPIGEGNFVRRAGEVNSYSVAPAISVDAEPRAWIDTRLLDIPTTAIQSVELKPATDAGYVLRREKPSEANSPTPGEQKPAGKKPGEADEEGFVLEAVPAGRKALDNKALAPSSSALSGLGAEDVAKASDIDFSKPTQAIFALSDGNILTLTGTAVGDKRWIEVQATKDATLAAKTQNRAFEVASYRYDAIFRPLDQLLVPKETKPPPGNKPAGPKPAAGDKSSAPKPKPGAASKSPTPAAPVPAP
jgi:hypothetical protein